MLCRIVGAPVQDGAGRMGCEMGPSALRTAGLVSALRDLGHEVEDLGAVQPLAARRVVHGNLALKALPVLIIGGFTSMGMPGLSGFVAELPIFLGIWQAKALSVAGLPLWFANLAQQPSASSATRWSNRTKRSASS